MEIVTHHSYAFQLVSFFCSLLPVGALFMMMIAKGFERRLHDNRSR